MLKIILNSEISITNNKIKYYRKYINNPISLYKFRY